MTTNSKTTSVNSITLGAIAGIISPIIWILLIIISASIYPGYSHLTNFISDLGAIEAPYPWIQRINFFQFGLANMILGIALYKCMEKPSVFVLMLQLIIGLGIFLSGIFPGHSSDPESHESFLHLIVGIPAFFSIILTPFISGLRFRKRMLWKDFSPYMMLMSLFLAMMFALMIRSDLQGSNGLTGLYQRLLLGTWILYMVLISLRILKLKRSQAEV